MIDPETDDISELSQQTREQVISSVTGYDGVDLATFGDPLTVKESEITTNQNGYEVVEYDVLIDTVGRLSLEEVMESHGLLLACSEDTEVKLAGFQDTEIALTVRERIEE